MNRRLSYEYLALFFKIYFENLMSFSLRDDIFKRGRILMSCFYGNDILERRWIFLKTFTDLKNIFQRKVEFHVLMKVALNS